MNRRPYLHQEPELAGGQVADSQLDFSTLYDRYAPVLLGVIQKIVSDKMEAIALLEKTFVKIHSQMDQFKPKHQPLFVWLLDIARRTALDVPSKGQPTPTAEFQLTSGGKIVALPIRILPVPADPRLNELLNAILFKNCTPEEAATSIGISTETVRQQLRLAMQPLRTGPIT